LLVFGRSGQFLAFKVNTIDTAPVTHRQLAARSINENSAHGLGGSRKKVRAIFKSRAFGPNKAEPGLMDESGGLKSLARRFASHLAGREPPQFAVEKIKKPFGGRGVALLRVQLTIAWRHSSSHMKTGTSVRLALTLRADQFFVGRSLLI